MSIVDDDEFLEVNLVSWSLLLYFPRFNFSYS